MGASTQNVRRRGGEIAWQKSRLDEPRVATTTKHFQGKEGAGPLNETATEALPKTQHARGRMCGVGCFVRTTRVGGLGSCGQSQRWRRLRFIPPGETSHSSTFFPCEFSKAKEKQSVLSSVRLQTKRLLRSERPTAVPCLIHWMIVGVSFVQGKEEVGFLPADVLSGWCRSLFRFVGKEEVEEGFLPVDVIFGLASVSFR